MKEPAPVMMVSDAEAFLALIPGVGRLLGLDLGTRNIGLALTDPTRSISSPFETLKRGKFSEDSQRIKALVTEQNIVGLVVGLPRHLDGGEGPRAQSARAYARNLTGILRLPVLLWDERFSTHEAERALLSGDTSRRRRAEVIDKVAAALILQGAIERLRALIPTA